MSRTRGHSRRTRQMTTPMWWNHETSIVPARHKAKLIAKKLVRQPEIADAEVWPDYKKPVVYYW